MHCGSGKQYPASVKKYSAKPPPAVRAQTASPTFHSVPSAPRAAICPLTSRPRIREAPSGGGYLTARCRRSGRFTPTNFTSINTSRAPGSGVFCRSIRSTSSPPPGSCATYCTKCGTIVKSQKDRSKIRLLAPAVKDYFLVRLWRYLAETVHAIAGNDSHRSAYRAKSCLGIDASLGLGDGASRYRSRVLVSLCRGWEGDAG